MVESLASGKPVIALARGGAVEIVEDGCGLLYEEGPDGCGLDRAIVRFEHIREAFDPAQLAVVASHYSEERFAGEFQRFLRRLPIAENTGNEPVIFTTRLQNADN